MRIHVVSPHWLPFRGGAEIVAAETARQLGSRHQVTVHTSTETQAAPARAGETVESGVRVVRYPTRAGAPLFRPRLDGADLVHVHGFYRPLLLATVVLARGRPVVVQPHGGALVQPGHGGSSTRRTVRRHLDERGLRLLRTRIAAFVCTSQDEVHRLAEIGFGDRPVLLAPGPLRQDLLDRAATSTASGKQEGRFCVVGRLVALKSVEVALQALVHAPRCSLVVVGAAEDQSYAARLVDLARSLGVTDRVDFTGDLPASGVADVLTSAVGCIATSRREGWGLSVAEALAFRAVPLVPAGMSSAHDALSESLGLPLRFPWGDAQELARLMERVVDAPRSFDAELAGGRTWAVTEFSPEAVAARVEALYARLLGASP